MQELLLFKFIYSNYWLSIPVKKGVGLTSVSCDCNLTVAQLLNVHLLLVTGYWPLLKYIFIKSYIRRQLWSIQEWGGWQLLQLAEKKLKLLNHTNPNLLCFTSILFRIHFSVSLYCFQKSLKLLVKKSKSIPLKITYNGF